MTFRIIFYSLFFLGKVPLLRLRRGDFVFVLFGFMGAAFGVPPPCGGHLDISCRLPRPTFFVTKKGSEKSPAVARQRTPP